MSLPVPPDPSSMAAPTSFIQAIQVIRTHLHATHHACTHRHTPLELRDLDDALAHAILTLRLPTGPTPGPSPEPPVLDQAIDQALYNLLYGDEDSHRREFKRHLLDALTPIVTHTQYEIWTQAAARLLRHREGETFETLAQEFARAALPDLISEPSDVPPR